MPSDTDWMREALKEGEFGRYLSRPNPAVGCVIVAKDGQVSRGFTQPPGSSHAEIDAIEKAKTRGIPLQGATLYVTLEPCSHYGRTPPCADRIVKEGFARVVVATLDANPLVAGKGIEKIKAAGIAVTVGCLEREAFEANRGFLTRMKKGRPWVRLKVAGTLDAKTALLNGESQWITGLEARENVQALRAEADGLLTGIGTVLADDPRMNVRVEGLPSPKKFVLDSFARTPLEAKILQGEKVTLFVSKDAPKERVTALEKAGCGIVALEGKNGELDLKEVLKEIGKREINMLHVEAGESLNGALLQKGLVDEVIYYMAPTIAGPGRSLAKFAEKTSMIELDQWNFVDIKRIGKDLRLTLRK